MCWHALAISDHRILQRLTGFDVNGIYACSSATDRRYSATLTNARIARAGGGRCERAARQSMSTPQ